MEFEYKNGTRDKKLITRKANEAVRAYGWKKFETNPTKLISKRGYWMIYVPKRGWMKEHHFIWEKKYNLIPSGKVLHHINFDRLDNRIENLELMDKKEHGKLHYAKRIIDKYGRFS